MILGYHGGMCCGIKTIFELGSDPSYIIDAKSKTDVTSYDKSYTHHKTDFNFFWPEAPRETYEERFVRYVEFCKKERPRGLVEVTLARANTTLEMIERYGYFNQLKWHPILKKIGFKKVSEFSNSNSGNIVEVWHLITPVPEKKKVTRKKKGE